MARPVAAGVLTIVGGFFILGGGILVAILGAVLAAFGFFSGFFFVGLGLGLLTIIVGVLMIAIPSGHLLWGALAIVFAVASIPFALGGVILGFILALVGGIVAVRWKPSSKTVIDVRGQVIPPPPR